MWMNIKAGFQARPSAYRVLRFFRYNLNYRYAVVRGEVFPDPEADPDAQLVITGDHANLPLPQSSNVTLGGLCG
jgi:hypothetical protein